MIFSWWVSALLAAIIWGVHYPLVDRALEHLTSFTVLLVTVTPIILLYPFFHSDVVADIAKIPDLPTTVIWTLVGLMVTSISASLLVYAAISGSNATLASLIEITYPLFVGLFSIAILQENHLSASVVIGGGLIAIGTSIVIMGHG